MSSLDATARGFLPVLVMLVCASPLAAQQATTTGNQSPAVVGNATINYNNILPEHPIKPPHYVADLGKGIVHLRNDGGDALDLMTWTEIKVVLSAKLECESGTASPIIYMPFDISETPPVVVESNSTDHEETVFLEPIVEAVTKTEAHWGPPPLVISLVAAGSFRET
jgi:hypothetical protein